MAVGEPATQIEKQGLSGAKRIHSQQVGAMAEEPHENVLRSSSSKHKEMLVLAAGRSGTRNSAW